MYKFVARHITWDCQAYYETIDGKAVHLQICICRIYSWYPRRCNQYVVMVLTGTDQHQSIAVVLYTALNPITEFECDCGPVHKKTCLCTLFSSSWVFSIASESRSLSDVGHPFSLLPPCYTLYSLTGSTSIMMPGNQHLSTALNSATHMIVRHATLLTKSLIVFACEVVTALHPMTAPMEPWGL